DVCLFFFSSRRRHTRSKRDWSSDVCSSDLELGRLNAGLVIEKRSLAALLKEPEPAARTREGDVHPFEPQVLARFASVLTRDEADALRLPLTLTVRCDSDEAILTDEIGAKALRTLENFGQAF